VKIAAFIFVTATLACGGGHLHGQHDRRTHIDRLGVVEMKLPRDSAFVLFQAEAERRWAVGWSPVYLYLNGAQQGEGTVFTTDASGHTTVWMVTENDANTGRIGYAYVIPGSRATQVDVQVLSVGSDRSRATVRYRMTALSADADDYVREFSDGFGAFLEHWEEAIDTHVVRGVPLPEKGH